MQDYTQEQIKKRYLALPEDLKDAMWSVDSSNIIQSIGKKHNLHIDQMGELASETGYVLLGFTRPENYIKNLSARLNINIKDARDIALEVNIEIFSKVKESLKKIHGIGEYKSEEPIFPAQNEDPKEDPKIIEPLKTEETKPVEITQEIKTQNINPEPEPLELTEKHFPEEIKYKIKDFSLPENLENQKFTADSQKEPDTLKETKPEIQPIKIEVKDTPSFSAQNAAEIIPKKNADFTPSLKQTTEIKMPEKETTKDRLPKTEGYKGGDPYREPV